MKTDIDEMVLQEAGQTFHLEELLLSLQKPEIIAELQDIVDGTEEDKEEPDLDQIFQDGNILLEIITEQAGAKRIWQIVTACFTILVIITSFICLGLYRSRENQIEKVGLTQANIQKISNDFAQADQKVKTLESQLASSKTELERTQGQLSNSSSDIKNLQNQLADTTQRLKVLQNSNAEAVAQLNERLRKLSD